MLELGFLLRATLGFLAGVVIMRSGKHFIVRGTERLDGVEIRSDKGSRDEVEVALVWLPHGKRPMFFLIFGSEFSTLVF